MTKIKERRLKPRIGCAYPTIVRGSDSSGKHFKVQGTLHNFSAAGLYLSLNRCVEMGCELSISFRFTSMPPEKIEAASLVARGVVVRSLPQSDGVLGLGIKLVRYRFH